MKYLTSKGIWQGFRSVLSILLGYVAMFVGFLVLLVVAGSSIKDFAKNELFSFWWVVVVIAVNTGTGVIGGLVTSRVAPCAPFKHAVVFAGIMAMGIFIFLLDFDLYPLWYTAGSSVFFIIGILLGGYFIVKWRARQGRVKSL